MVDSELECVCKIWRSLMWGAVPMFAETTENLSQKDRRVDRDMNFGRPHYENGVRW
jgi:hypothetical protein